MYRYEGRIIHESHDDDGVLEVVDYKGVRSLHFGSASRQSSMLIAEPDKLELSYVRAMTSWLLFKQNWDEALLIGLGGGSLAKYLLHHFSDARIKAVEYRQSVVKVARSHFGLPLDPRLKIIISDGGDFVRQRTETCMEKYCLLMVDAFDHDGMADSINNEAFFDACKVLLKNDGILVVNLWGGTKNPVFQQVALWLGRVFNWKVLFLPVRNRGNIIALAFNDGVPHYSLQDLKSKTEALEQLYQIEFSVFLKDLCKHNASTLSQVITT
jgi:spermidine synthase